MLGEGLGPVLRDDHPAPVGIGRETKVSNARASANFQREIRPVKRDSKPFEQITPEDKRIVVLRSYAGGEARRSWPVAGRTRRRSRDKPAHSRRSHKPSGPRPPVPGRSRRLFRHESRHARGHGLPRGSAARSGTLVVPWPRHPRGSRRGRSRGGMRDRFDHDPTPLDGDAAAGPSEPGPSSYQLSSLRSSRRTIDNLRPFTGNTAVARGTRRPASPPRPNRRIVPC